ncbi:hypothetical protein LPJ74_002642 [Coemansia sp. RSA 1843]|nr:hypothetical protein LPJ74_002642 [Coemansia sp. RSA 1843]
MEKKRVEKVTDFFDSINHIHEEDIAKYFYSIGWKIKDSRKEQSSINMADRIPNPSIMFLVQDATLTQMAQTASQYSSSTGGAHVEDVKQAVENNLHHVRDFLDFIPGYSTISSLIDLTNNPIVNAISQIISLSYKYPTASYLQLVLIYYRDIGMPGLQGIMDYPSQYVGSIASSVVATTIITLLASAYAAPAGLKIPGILNLDLGGSAGGLHLDVLGGLINANIGGGHKKTTPRNPPATHN